MAPSVIGDNVIPSVGSYTDYATVLAVQKALSAKGFTPNKGMDGKWGPDTQETLRSWQYESGQPVTGVIDYGVLLALGVSRPGTSAATASASSSSALADATRRAHAAVPSDAEIAQKAQAVSAAKAKVAAAPTPQASQMARQELAVAEQRLAAVQPSFFAMNVPGLERPLWQVLLGTAGVVLLSAGIMRAMRR